MPPKPLLARSAAGWRSDGLDLLRALLALYVIAVHLGEWKPGAPAALTSFDRWGVVAFQSHSETNPAVLAFIALSGYCIHRNGARDRDWSTATFAIRRWFRITPVFFAATVVGAGTLELLRSHTDIRAITETSHITAGCLTAKVTGAAAFAPGLLKCSYQGNAPLNTVMVEIWLYVAYGLAVWLMLRAGERVVLTMIGFLAVAGFAFIDANPGDLGWWGNSSLVGFLAYWWVGAATVGISCRSAIRLLAASAAGWIALTGVLERSAGPHAMLALAELRKVAFVVSFAAAIALIDHTRLRLPGAVTFLGRSGYSLYAFHAPLLMIIVAYGLPWWFGFVLPITGALVSYRLLEQPAIRFGRRLVARRLERAGTSARDQTSARATA